MATTTGITILAAGSSSRLGQPKQLLNYNGSTLINHAVAEATAVAAAAVVVVIGANKQVMQEELQHGAANVYYHADWPRGMGSSIASGLEYLLQIQPDIQSCIFTVCDQPFITAQVFLDLIAHFETTGKGIIASAYAETLGTPMLFSHTYFDALMNLDGQEGAKKLLQLYNDDVAFISFEKGAVDIDTQNDYNNLINS